MRNGRWEKEERLWLAKMLGGGCSFQSLHSLSLNYGEAFAGSLAGPLDEAALRYMFGKRRQEYFAAYLSVMSSCGDAFVFRLLF